VTPYASGRRWTLWLGDSLAVLPTLDDASVDGLVTDPPYELGFMGKCWDKAGIAFSPDLWREALRVLKPGGHLLAFGGPRTYHRLACAIEDAGFEIRDSIHWIFGSGFPKSLDVSKAIDKAAGAERNVVRIATRRGNSERRGAGEQGATYGDAHGGFTTIGEPVTDAAKQWEGWGTALKPAHEPIVVARKPLVGTVEHNVREHGTGALNIDGCRVYGTPSLPGSAGYKGGDSHVYGGAWNDTAARRAASYRANPPKGRWPANVVLSHDPSCRRVGQREVKSGVSGRGGGFRTEYVGGVTRETELAAAPWGSYGDASGIEAVEDWSCEPGCPVAALDAQSGSASRFFPTFSSEDDGLVPFLYCAKASRSEREAGCENLPARTAQEAVDRDPESAGAKNPRAGAGRGAGAVIERCSGCGKAAGASARRGRDAVPCPANEDGICTPVAIDVRAPVCNIHPTVKPVALMRWLVRLVTPPDGIVLDPFTGSGTTGIAALREGVRFVGVEREADYLPIAVARVESAAAEGHQVPMFGGGATGAPSLFGSAR
jgi:site-specific DNA-methyltransferase (adenine-specific)